MFIEDRREKEVRFFKDVPIGETYIATNEEGRNIYLKLNNDSSTNSFNLSKNVTNSCGCNCPIKVLNAKLIVE